MGGRDGGDRMIPYELQLIWAKWQMIDRLVIWAMVFYVMQIADGVTTYIALKMPGIKEGNPAMRWVFERIGILPAIVIIKTFYIVMMYFGARQMGADMVMLAAIAYVAVVIWNIGKIRKHRQS